MMHTRPHSIAPPLLGAAILLSLAAAVGIPPAAHAANSPLADRIEQFLADKKYSKARVGVHVVAAGSGRVIYSRNAMDRFIAASNEKLVTAAAALDALGADYEFTTALYADGAAADGVLQGNLILRGGGDPTIGGRHEDEGAVDVFKRWASQLKAGGIRRVTGGLIADDSFFDRTHRHPNWSKHQAWKWYYTTSSALSINDNCVTVTVRPGGAAGAPALVEVSPPGAPVELKVTCKTHVKKHAIWFDRAAGSNLIKVGGHVRLGSKGYSGEVTVPNPPLYAAAVLKATFEAEGVPIEGEARLARKGEARAHEQAEMLCVRRTPILPVLRTMVKTSHNHYAEQVIRTTGAEASGVGSWRAGAARAGRLIRELGFRASEFQLDDGSGLSRHNILTPALVTSLLVHMRNSDHGRAFRSLLAVSGGDGTLRKRLSKAPYRGNVRAKTGYLSGVGALGGYATARSGLEVAFSILINDAQSPAGTYSMRQTADAICRAIVDLAE